MLKRNPYNYKQLSACKNQIKYLYKKTQVHFSGEILIIAIVFK